MKKIEFNVFPEGKRKAVTFSYDDGQIFDVKLAEMFDDYGIRCTFNLNSPPLRKTLKAFPQVYLKCFP